MTLLTLNENDTEPVGYTERKVVKAVIIDTEGKTLLLGSTLVGGGVEEGESYEEALYREALEEAGMKIEIIRPLGQVISYRDALRKKYATNGYLCKYIETTSSPTTKDAGELSKTLMWKRPEEAIPQIESEIENLKATDRNLYNLTDSDGYQSRLYNRQTCLAFLREAFKV